MTASSSQAPDLTRYLARRGFAPNPGNPTWLERETGRQTIRVLHEPGETTLLYCLAPHGVCLYEAVFSPGTPDAVITAAIEAALSRAKAATSQGGHGPAARPREGSGDPP